MSDIIIGVIVGGIIASIAPIAQLIYNHFHWKKEANIAHLKEKRNRLSTKNGELIEKIGKAIFEGGWSANLTSEISILLPKSASEILFDYLGGKDKSAETKRAVLHDIAFELRKEEAAVDCQIEKLLS